MSTISAAAATGAVCGSSAGQQGSRISAKESLGHFGGSTRRPREKDRNTSGHGNYSRNGEDGLKPKRSRDSLIHKCGNSDQDGKRERKGGYHRH
jgi:hypothetical protein